MDDPNNSPPHDDYERYLRERSLLIETENRAAEGFDKYMITISSSAIGLSFLIAKFVVEAQLIFNRTLLGTAWVSLTLSLFLILSAFLSSQFAFRRQIELLDAQQANRRSVLGNNRLTTTSAMLNWLSLGFLLSGLIFLSIFCLTLSPRSTP